MIDAEVAVDELAQAAVVVDRARARAAADEQLEARDAERVLHVDGDQADAEAVLGRRPDPVLARPRRRLAARSWYGTRQTSPTRSGRNAAGPAAAEKEANSPPDNLAPPRLRLASLGEVFGDPLIVPKQRLTRLDPVRGMGRLEPDDALGESRDLARRVIPRLAPGAAAVGQPPPRAMTWTKRGRPATGSSCRGDDVADRPTALLDAENLLATRQNRLARGQLQPPAAS